MPRMKDSRIKGWVAAVVITVLVGAILFFGIRMTYIQAQLIESLESNYKLLSAQYERFQEDYDLLYSKYTELTSDYESVESDFKSFELDYKVLEGRVSELQRNNDKLEDENKELRRLLVEYEKVPHDYYSVETFSHRSNVFSELEDFLRSEFVLPRAYEADVFDCSESVAYLEWALENAGFEAYIAVGPVPWDPSSGYHAWVIAYTEESQVAIEATVLTGEYSLPWIFARLFPSRTPGIVYQDDQQISGWQNYYEGYDYLFKNIFEAYLNDMYSIEEWNWWEGYWGFK